MSEASSHPFPTALASNHLKQQHKLAKDLIRAARSGDSAAIARIRALFPNTNRLRLVDAQLVIARDAGFDSWTALVRHVESEERAAAAAALHSGDAPTLRRLLAGSQYLRSVLNAPVFDFGRQAIHVAAKNPDVIDVLIDFGADPDAPSNWDKGPYVPLDDATEVSARHLLSRGATLTPNVAARFGWIDELRALLDARPDCVHHRGGDGRQPLHEAKNPAVAELLLSRGASIDEPCFDHKSSPAQYALVDRPDVCRFLLKRGARPDLFIAARLGDELLAREAIKSDPTSVSARVNFDGYPPVPRFNIYCWTLGWYKSPWQVALEAGHSAMAGLIDSAGDPKTRFLNAVWRGDRSACEAMLAAEPRILSLLSPQDHKLLPHAAHLRNDAACFLMIEFGFDPNAIGLDGGTTLHQAAWTGAADLLEALLKTGRCDLEQRDSTHGSTVLGWAAHGSAHCRHRRGDYVRTVELLIASGARRDVPANKLGTSMFDQAQGNAVVQGLIGRQGGSAG